MALTWIFAIDDPRLRFPAFLAGMFAAGLAWAALLFTGLGRWWPAGAIVAVAVRVAFVLTPPALSDDVFRYVYEGRVVWSMGPAFVFTHAPANALADGVPPALLNEAWLRINHPHLATIYPPFAQLVFAIAAGHLVVLKTLLVAAELAAYFLLAKKFGPERAILLALSPLAAFEIAHEGHADSLAMLGLALGGIAALAAGKKERILGEGPPNPLAAAAAINASTSATAPSSPAAAINEASTSATAPSSPAAAINEASTSAKAPSSPLAAINASTSAEGPPHSLEEDVSRSRAARLAFAGFALAALAKLNGLIALLPMLRATRRGWWIAAGMLGLLAVPYLIAGGGERAALFAYAGAWRSGDGAFSLILAIAEAIVGGDWTRVGGVTVTRHQLARAIAAGVFFAYAAVLLRKRPSMEEVPERAAALLLALLLLSPTLHPWYTLWLLPFLPFTPRLAPAITAALVLAPLLHHGTWLELVEGRWRELGFVRALVHVPVWALFGYARFACPSKKAS